MNLNLIETAQYYGLKLTRGGFTNCIFHSDRTPSMKLYSDHFHCFGCAKHGDIITLTEQLFTLPPYQAVQKLAQDFHILQNGGDEKITPIKSGKQSYTEQENQIFKLLNLYCTFLEKCREDYRPKTLDDDLHPLFVESLMKYEQYNYYRDVFITGTDEERREFMTAYAKQIASLEQRFIQNITGGNINEPTTKSTENRTA